MRLNHPVVLCALRPCTGPSLKVTQDLGDAPKPPEGLVQLLLPCAGPGEGTAGVPHHQNGGHQQDHQGAMAEDVQGPGH